MWMMGVCAFASMSLLAFSLTQPLSLGGMVAMTAGVLGILLTPLSAFSGRARGGLWYLGWALALATWLTPFALTTVVVHVLAVVVFVVAGSGSERANPAPGSTPGARGSSGRSAPRAGLPG
jgi:hypothetical protein